MKQAGFFLGLLLLLLVAYITDYSIILLIKGGNLTGTNTYQSLVNRAFGFVGYMILSILQFLYPFIAMISYNIITGDTLTKVFQRFPGVGPDSILANRHFVVLATTVLFTLPLSLYRNITKLGKVSLLSLILTVVILLIVIVRVATLGPHITQTEGAWTFAHPSAIQAIGVMSFAFVCHHNSFLISGSLEVPTITNWSRITHVSVLFALFVSILFAASGYATFTGYTQGDIFENYCKHDNLATFGRLCYGITIILTFPAECFVTREVITNVFFSGTLSSVFHAVVTMLIIAVVTAISLTYDCLGIVLELNGVVSAIPLVFIIPMACYLKLSEEEWYNAEKLKTCLILIVGILVMIIGFIFIFLYPHECSHGKEMLYCMTSNSSIYNVTVPT
ncbi:putative sodium-coupled neutral amino acid transporter 11 [Latimeria chalumnae]|uniref:putative sodium-coupled neutral amino acid transporter 11 n=1 Tax=Latimeria chalumnae TaxID=7897 RepID=UPI0003C12696|nr:PREDICTED: putative sodium-coupled neutral amino acid transporter 11 [Latimeria chalumnae]|eukprot:XP_006003662.1 PREDICTED: putative sodium-coupled neutral amino acid transporter 11 [Latimeria chalumnae]